MPSVGAANASHGLYFSPASDILGSASLGRGAGSEGLAPLLPSPTPFLDLIHGPQHMKGNCKPGTRCVNAEAAAASSWEMVRALATQQLRSERDGGGRAVTRLLTRTKFVKIQEVSSSSQFQRSWALSSVLKEGWPLVPIIVNCLKICLLNNYTVQWPLWKSSCFSLLPFNSTPPAQTRGMCRLLG